MTEVPEHLLQRSRERRAALGGESAPPAAPAGGGGDEGDARGGEVVPAAAAAPAVVEEAAPPRVLPPYVQAALVRKKMPVWMPPVGIAALLWVFVYAGVLFSPGVTISDPVLLQGQEVFATQCSGCHGGGGEGGTGRPLAGQALLTFPKIEDHIAWVHDGSPAKGTPYGDPNRPGGQHISQDNWGAMPAFGDALSEEEILAVVRYEREVLNDATPESDQSAEGAAGGSEGEQTSGGSAGSSGDTKGASGGDEGTNDAQSKGGETDSQGSTTTTTAE
jgi:mono/diheme cytochrome c family protein